MCFPKWFIKKYIKSIDKDKRDLRLVFVGKRLKAKQAAWLHFNSHPYELNKGE